MTEKIELFDQNYGLTSLKKERFLILSKMDICSSLKKAGFYPPHHFTLFLASFPEKCFKGKTECFDQNHAWVNPVGKIQFWDSEKRTFLSYSPERFFFYLEQNLTFNVSN